MVAGATSCLMRGILLKVAVGARSVKAWFEWSRVRWMLMMWR